MAVTKPPKAYKKSGEIPLFLYAFPRVAAARKKIPIRRLFLAAVWGVSVFVFSEILGASVI